MRVWYILVICLLLGSCARIFVCDYPLTEEGWFLAQDVPEELTDQYNVNDQWFKNDKGDYFACPRMVGPHHCGNVYQKFNYLENGTYEAQEIVCISGS